MMLAATQLTVVSAQQNPQDETVKVTTTVVQTEAIVTDKSGRRIKGLTAADFTVLDEGKPQSVDFFTAIESSRVREGNINPSSTATTANTAASTAPPLSPLTIPYQGRYIALVFDDLNLTNENFLRARKAFAEYINTKLTPTDMVALISTGGAVASLQQFTTDKQLLLSGLNRLGARNTNASSKGRPWNMTDDEALRIDKGDFTALNRVKSRAQAEGSDQGPTRTIADEAAGPGVEGVKMQSKSDDERDSTEQRIKNFARAIVSEISRNSQNNIETLKSIFKGMSDLPGRKIVVLMTEAFGTAGGTSEDLNYKLNQLIDTARRGGISVYALDAGGLRTNNVSASENVSGLDIAVKNANPDLSMSNFEQLGAARKLVSGTGGQLISNTNALAEGLSQAVEDSNTYYVLGFQPAALDNKFHRLTISVKDKSDYIVRTRRGYLASNPDTIKGTNAEILEAMLRSPVTMTDLPVELVANVVPSAGGFVVVTGLHIGRNYLSLPAATAADQTASYEVVSYVFAAGRDQAVGGVVKTFTYDLGKDAAQRQKLKTEGFVYVPTPFNFEPGIYQIRAVVREKTSGLVGSATQFFEVPDLKDRKNAMMSSIVMTPAGQPTFSGTNSFKPGSDVDIRFVLFNLKDAAGVTQRVILKDVQGKELFNQELPLQMATGTDRSQSPQSTRFNLPPARGRYSVTVTLKDAKGKTDLERRADFVIE
jgi:VWFA-related protein